MKKKKENTRKELQYFACRLITEKWIQITRFSHFLEAHHHISSVKCFEWVHYLSQSLSSSYVNDANLQLSWASCRAGHATKLCVRNDEASKYTVPMWSAGNMNGQSCWVVWWWQVTVRHHTLYTPNPSQLLPPRRKYTKQAQCVVVVLILVEPLSEVFCGWFQFSDLGPGPLIGLCCAEPALHYTRINIRVTLREMSDRCCWRSG